MSNAITATEPPERPEFEKQGGKIIQQANDLQIVDPSSFEEAGAFLLEIKRVGKVVEEKFEEPCSKAHGAWKSLVALRDGVLRPFRSAETIVKQKMGDYNFQIQEQRRKEAEKANAAARKAAEEARAKEIAELKAQGDKEAAAQLKAQPIIPQVDPGKIKTPEPPKVKGVTFRQEYDFMINDARKVPLEYQTPDLVKIGKLVKALGKDTVIAGVTVYPKQVVTGRG
jgi:hypothetical protein